MNLNWPPMPRALTLAANSVHLFAAATDLPAQQAAAFEALLPEEEREKLAKLRVPARRAELAISRGVLRQVLSQFLHLAPQPHRISHQCPWQAETGEPFAAFQYVAHGRRGDGGGGGGWRSGD